MEKCQYDELKRVQRTHWWFKGKEYIAMEMYKHFCKKENARIFDVGCGMGLTIADLAHEGEVFGMDMEAEAVEYCRENFSPEYGLTHVKQGYLPNNVPFEGQFDTVVALDVLEHIEDDVGAMIKIHDILKDGGKFLVTVPALMSMWSGNDELNHHFRRYEKKELIEKIQKAGFRIIKCSFYNSRLFIPAYIVRKVKNMLGIKSSDVSENVRDSLMNRILTRIFMSESKTLRMGEFKIGVSLILIAEKVS